MCSAGTSQQPTQCPELPGSQIIKNRRDVGARLNHTGEVARTAGRTDIGSTDERSIPQDETPPRFLMQRSLDDIVTTPRLDLAETPQIDPVAFELDEQTWGFEDLRIRR